VSRRPGPRPHDPLDRREHALPGLLGVAAHVELQQGVVGNEVAPGAGVDTAGGHHRDLPGRDLAGHDGLQPDDDHGREYHRVDGVLRHGAMAALPVHGHVDAVLGRHEGAGACADRPGDAGQHMLGQGNVGSREALEQAIVDHALGAVAGLLGRLEEREQGSGPLATVIGHELGHAEQAGHVHVVATGMGHRHLVACGIQAGRSARVVRAGIFPDGQCVQFSSEQYGGSAAIGQDAHHSRTADASVDREAIFLQFPGDALGGVVLLVG
jgi:hypothetical protein